jgi:acyl-CoA thioesterase
MDIKTLIETGKGRDPMRFSLPGNWMQGRTAYGGISAVLALTAARAAVGESGPLRSVQVAYIAPLAGSIEARGRVLRRGRNAAFVQADLAAGGELGLAACFVFGNHRESAIAYQALPHPETLDPDDTEPRPHRPQPNIFTGHLDYRPAMRKKIEGRPEILRWVRLREREGIDWACELLAIGDALPPSALPLLSEFKPASSFNWTVNFLCAAPKTSEGWWLVHSFSPVIRDGISCQMMTVWNRDGEPMAQAMQSVAIFG